MILSELIRNGEQRLVSYKKMLGDVGRDKTSFPPGDELVEWYRSMLREVKNMEQGLLKKYIKEKTHENQGLNPPFCYP